MRRLLLLCLLWTLPLPGASDWGPIQFLVGTWTGDGSGQPGQGSGEFSFAEDLQGKILVRKNFADYPAANGRPAFRHDDLMIVYRDEASHDLKATYFDSEGHVIPYTVKAVDGGVVFVSEGPGMRYRLTYTNSGANSLKLKFEIAQAGKDFAPYIEAAMKRK